MPTRLAGTDANPVASVTALPMDVPFNVKLTVCPARGPLGVLSVAESVVLPPYAPLAGATASVVVAGCATVTVALAELLAAFASTAELLLMLTVFVVTVPSAIDRLGEATRVTV